MLVFLVVKSKKCSKNTNKQQALDDNSMLTTYKLFNQSIISFRWY